MIAHMRSLARFEADPADYPEPGDVSFPERLHVAFAVCHPECGAREFVVGASTSLPHFHNGLTIAPRHTDNGLS
jgi:hypothetical protein